MGLRGARRGQPARPDPVPLDAALLDLPWEMARFTDEPRSPPVVPKDVSVVAPYCWSFLNWTAWQRKRYANPTAPRPTNIPAAIPELVLAAPEADRTSPSRSAPTATGSPAGTAEPPNTWQLPFPVMSTAWGPLSDSQYRDNDEAWVRMRRPVSSASGSRSRAAQPLFGPVASWPDPRARHDRLDLGRRASRGRRGARDDPRRRLLPAGREPRRVREAMTNFRAGVGDGISRSVFTTLYGFNTFVRRPPTDVPRGTAHDRRVRGAAPDCQPRARRVLRPGRQRPLPDHQHDLRRQPEGLRLLQPGYRPLARDTDHRVPPGPDPDTLDAYGRQIGVYLCEG